MFDILKAAFGRLVHSRKLPSSDATAEEGSYWENELALFAPMEFLPAGQQRRTRLEPKSSATIHPPETQESSSAALPHKLVEPV
jgi:hypothetical protein